MVASTTFANHLGVLQDKGLVPRNGHFSLRSWWPTIGKLYFEINPSCHFGLFQNLRMVGLFMGLPLLQIYLSRPCANNSGWLCWSISIKTTQIIADEWWTYLQHHRVNKPNSTLSKCAWRLQPIRDNPYWSASFPSASWSKWKQALGEFSPTKPYKTHAQICFLKFARI